MKKKEDKIEDKDSINENTKKDEKNKINKNAKKEIKEELNKKEKTNKESENENKELKKGFLKKVWYSIDKIEKYAELSTEGLKSALKYLAILVLIIGVISSVSNIYKTSLVVNKISQYIDEKIPDLSYSDNTLKVENSETIIDENEEFGKIIVDTNTDDEQQINKYVNDVKDEENAVIILKNKLILKTSGVSESANYNYEDLFGQMEITEFNKQQLVDYLTGSTMFKYYANLFLTLFIYAFAVYLINTLFYIIIISMVGFLATMILKLKIRFVAVFNMAVYAITLPTILNIIYIIVNAFYKYVISYFDVMYVMISTIYILAAIFMLKIEFNKKQSEVQKIVEVEKEVKEEQKEEGEKTKEDKKDSEKKETKKKSKKEKSKEKEPTEENNEPGEPEGSNA